MTNSTTPVSLADLIAQGEVAEVSTQLNQEEKEKLAEKGTAFTLTAATFGDDEKYGPYTLFTAMIDGKERTFRMYDNDNRQAFILSLANALGNAPISGVKLKAYPGAFGNKYITIEPA